MTEEPLFRSTKAALAFAFNYHRHQSPDNPLASMSANMDSFPIVSGKGLVGLDAAAQAGMIFITVWGLSDEQFYFIIAKYGIDMKDYKGVSICDFDLPPKLWVEAIEYFSIFVELEGVPKKLRKLMVEKAIHGGALEVGNLTSKYSLSERTLYRQFSEIKSRLKKIEKLAMINLNNVFYKKESLVA